MLIPLACLAQYLAGHGAGLYTGRWRVGSFDEVAALGWSAAFTTVAIFITDLGLTTPRLLPLSVPFAAGVAALVVMAGARYLGRAAFERQIRPSGDKGDRILVFGAGEGGAQAITAMLRNPASPYVPVALLDDDWSKRNRRIMGVPMAGSRQHLAAAAAACNAQHLLIAIPSATAKVISELDSLAAQAGLNVKVLPPVAELFGNRIGVGDIRDVTIADLLGRHQVETDLGSIAGYLTGKRVVVTGAGGSIGSELCRQIYRFAPAELMMLDRDESALHAVQLSIEGRALLDSPNLLLADIRDRPTLQEIFEKRRPQVVFHAAALKHLTLLENHPVEGFKTNVLGTLDLLEVAESVDVERFVNISTDKAADPVSVLGRTKRIAERLTAHFSAHASGTYLSVRFGNVLGSRGSVLTTFQHQVETGGPMTVTPPDATRYFMTVEEAVQLVIQAGAIGSDGEVLVLDMGEPVRISDVAARLAQSSDRPIEIVYTGLRPGEKLHEVRFGADETDNRPLHPLISHGLVPPVCPETVRTQPVGNSSPRPLGNPQ